MESNFISSSFDKDNKEADDSEDDEVNGNDEEESEDGDDEEEDSEDDDDDEDVGLDAVYKENLEVTGISHLMNGKDIPHRLIALTNQFSYFLLYARVPCFKRLSNYQEIWCCLQEESECDDYEGEEEEEEDDDDLDDDDDEAEEESTPRGKKRKLEDGGKEDSGSKKSSNGPTEWTNSWFDWSPRAVVRSPSGTGSGMGYKVPTSTQPMAFLPCTNSFYTSSLALLH